MGISNPRRSKIKTALAVPQRDQNRGDIKIAPCNQMSAVSLKNARLNADIGALKSAMLPPAYHGYKKATARNAPTAVAQVALHEKEPLHEPRKSGARFFSKGFNPNQATAVNQILKIPASPSTEKPAQRDAATRRSRLAGANRFQQN